MGWTIPGVRPEIPVLQTNASLHVLCCISICGIDMLMCRKGSVTATDINTFFRVYFDLFQSRRVVLLDNAAVHKRPDLQHIADKNDPIFIYNVPKNPDANPIEWIFATVKQKYRYLTKHDSIFRSTRVIEAFSSVQRTCNTSTVAKCLASNSKTKSAR